MKFFSLYKNQFDRKDKVYNSEIFLEYFNLYRFLNNVEFENDIISEGIKKEIIETDSRKIEQIERIVRIVEEKVLNLEKKSGIEFITSTLEGAIFIYGDGSIDGHGIIVEGKAYVIFDIRAIYNGFENYDFQVFILHELIHPVHYLLNGNFYFDSYKDMKDKYFKRMAAEGIATYLSGEILKDKEEKQYWLGYFDIEDTKAWKKRCEKERRKTGEDITYAIKKNELDEKLYYQLFSIVDPDDLEGARLAYYYGSEIWKKLSEEYSVRELLEVEEEEIYKRFLEYFEIV